MPKNNPQLFTSSKKDWRTPPKLYSNLNKEFDFWIDLAADKENTFCQTFFNESQNALKQDWQDFAIKNGSLGRFGWCNPPYGRDLVKWIKKAYEENLLGFKSVWLIPARTDTKFFHQFIFGKAKTVCFIKSRIAFLNNDNKPEHKATFPSMIVVFAGHKVSNTEFLTMDVHGNII